MKNNIPVKLRTIILGRKDLLDLELLELKNERILVKWLLKHGFYEHPELLESYKNENELNDWLKTSSNIRPYENFPRIFLGIWDNLRSHQRRWPFPYLNDFYDVWLQRNWSKLDLKLPPYQIIFDDKLSMFRNIEFFICEFLWLLRKPLSILTKKFFGVDFDYFFANKFLGWTTQINVIKALVYRELKTRVSQVRFGVVGVFVEPLGVMAVFLLIFSILRANTGPLDTWLFLGTGIVFFTLFNDIAIRSSNGMLANEALFFYKPVKPIDTVIARTVVEAGLYAIVFLVIILGTFLFKQKIQLYDISLMVSSYIALVIVSFGLGLILLVSTYIYPSIIQLIPLMMRPLWLVSGVFISLRNLPQWIRPYLSWNPIIQAIEIARYAFTSDYIIDKNVISLIYLWQTAGISLFLGLWLYSINEKRLLTR